MTQDIRTKLSFVIFLICMMSAALVSGLQEPAFAEGTQEVAWQQDGVTLTGVTDGESVTITGCACEEQFYEVKIPETIEELPVRGIDSNAFQGNESITAVTLPDGVESLPYRAFYSCSSLRSIDLNQVRDLGDLSTGWTRLGLTTSLETIKVADDNPAFIVSDGILFSRDMKTLLLYPPLRPGKTYVIPDTVTTLWSNAFNETREIEEVTLSPGIGNYWDSFRSCPNLRVLNLNMLSFISGDNFVFCEALEKVTVSDDNPVLEVVDGVLFSEDKSILYFCPPARPGDSYTIPAGVSVIGNRAFSISQLKWIEMPDSLREIRSYAFEYAQNLEYIEFPEGLERIESSACVGCESLKAVYVPDSVKNIAYGSLDGPMMGPYAVIYGHTRGADGEYTYVYRYVSEHADEYIFKDIDEEPMFTPVPQTITGVSKVVKVFGCPDFVLNQSARTTLRYKSSNSKIATVSPSGTVRILRPGTVRITVTATGTREFIRAVKTVTVTSKVKTPVLRAKRGSGKVKLSWDQVPKARGYQLYVKFPGSKKFQRVLTESSKVKSVTHRGLSKGKTYKYKLRAFTKVGGKTYYSAFSKVRTVKIR